MSARLLEGAPVAAAIRAEVAELVRQWDAGPPPGLAVILAGNNPASEVYVRSKVRSCRELGIHSEEIRLPASVSTAALLQQVAALNARNDIDGILVQLPLPAGVDTAAVLLAVDPAKDVDGFHPVNLGRLVTQRPGLVPCTPAGIIQLLERSGIEIAGREAV
ncbi:MAG TPA: tetrahydrofolate dehydrogenase/cyclohydrolase catalytic domain-containing protein, partial [Terriglobales bacterium]|nr:tetrahydrofolate dehydrogenase/cyclohydrolase catalytic domain-containing protein [Terriglobales bacterium]